jgi:quinol monooxygenase YgiN
MSSEGGFAITVAFQLEQGAFADFCRLVRENATESVRREEGCLRFDVLTPVDPTAETGVTLYEIYTDRTAFELHLASDHFKIFDERSRPLVKTKTVAAFSVAQNAKR